MNRLICHVCQQQFKTASGHRWHLSRIHDLSDEDRSSPEQDDLANGYEAGSPRPATPYESEVRELIEELAGQDEAIAEQIRVLSEDLAVVKRRLLGPEAAARTIQALTTEVARLSAKGLENDTSMQAIVGLLWELDRPRRGSPKLTDLATRVVVGAADVACFRETIQALLRNQKL